MASGESNRRVVDGRYALVNQRGKGGMGTVWEAEDQVLQRRVAVKEIPVASGRNGPATTVRERSMREARAAARISDHRVVSIFDVVDDEEHVFLVQELVDAPNLKEVVLRDGPLAPAAVAHLGLQLLEGLDAAHAVGIVHRDLKPSNVMLLPGGRVKIADFGVAQLAGDPDLTASGTVVGSPGFLAPEQASGDDVGPAADLWSLGVTLWFAVEGRAPYDGTGVETLSQVVHGQVPRASNAGPLQPVLDALLRKDPAERAGGQRLRALLEEASANQADATTAMPASTTAVLAAPVPDSRPGDRSSVGAPIPDRPAQPARGAPSPPRRSRAVAVIAALVIALLFGGLVLGALLTGGGDQETATVEPPADDTPPADTDTPDDGAGTAEPDAPADDAPAAAPPDDPSDGWATHADPTAGYTVEYPQGWQVEQLDGTRTDFVDPASGVYLRLDWTDAPGPSHEEAWREQSASFADRYDDYEEIRIEPTTFQGHDAALWEYAFTDGGARLHAHNLGFTADGRGYALNLVAPEAQWSQALQHWDELTARFRLTG